MSSDRARAMEARRESTRSDLRPLRWRRSLMSSTTSCSAAVASAAAAVDSSRVVPDADAAGAPRLDSASAAVRTSREDRRSNDMTWPGMRNGTSPDWAKQGSRSKARMGHAGPPDRLWVVASGGRDEQVHGPPDLGGVGRGQVAAVVS